jgi:hypothetical protein
VILLVPRWIFSTCFRARNGAKSITQRLNVDVSSYGDAHEPAMTNLKKAVELFF